MLTVDEASNTAQRYWNRTPYRPKVIFRNYSVEAVRSMVANGMGVSILSSVSASVAVELDDFPEAASVAFLTAESGFEEQSTISVAVVIPMTLAPRASTFMSSCSTAWCAV